MRGKFFRRSKVWQHRTGRLLATLLAPAILLAFSPSLLTSAGASSGVTIAVSTAGTQITAHVKAPSATVCSLSVSAKSKQAHFSPDKIPSNRTLTISWAAPSNAPSGVWTFRAACTRHSRSLSGATSVHLSFSGDGHGNLVLVARAQSSQPGGKGGGNQSCQIGRAHV